MNQSNHRKLRFEGLEDRRLAAGVTLQSSYLLSLLRPTTTTQLAFTTSTQQSTLTYSAFQPATSLAPGISVNHNETLVCLGARALAK